MRDSQVFFVIPQKRGHLRFGTFERAKFQREDSYEDQSCIAFHRGDTAKVGLHHEAGGAK